MEEIVDRLTSELSPEKLELFWAFLNRNFKSSELRSKDSQLKAFKHKTYRVSYIDGAFVLWWDFKKLIFCEYIVVSTDTQRMGIGTRLLKHMSYKKKPIVLEVGKKSTLLSFYTKNGFVVNNYGYNALPLNEEEAEDYYLLSYKETLTQEEYAYFLEEINKPEYQF